MRDPDLGTTTVSEEMMSSLTIPLASERNARFYEDKYGNRWMAYDSTLFEGHRCRIMLPVGWTQ